MAQSAEQAEMVEPAARRTGAPAGAPGEGLPKGAAAAAPPGPGKDAAKPQRPWRRIALGAALVAVVGGGTIYWLATRNLETTDDAFVDGDAATISPRVAGPVVALHVTDNQFVHQGDLLLEIDPRDYQVAVENAKASLANAIAQEATAQSNLALTQATTAATLEQADSGVAYNLAALAQARAQVDAAEAEQVRARSDIARYSKLVSSNFASRQQYEQAEAKSRTADAQLRAALDGVKVAEGQLSQARGKLDEAKTGPQQVAVREAELKAATAQVAAAQAALEQAELNLSYTDIYAPHDGFITKRNVNVGDVLQKDQNLAAFVFGRAWVTANFKETQLTRMRPGQPVDVAVDAYPDKVFKAHVDSIQRGTGARFSLLPPENATGNYVKVVQRVPVKIVFDEAPDPRYVLSLGMSVIPTVDVGVDPSRPAKAAQN